MLPPLDVRQRAIRAPSLASRQLLAQLNGALALKYGPGEWVRFLSASGAVLNRATIMAANADLAAVAEETRLLLLDQPSIGAAYTRAQLESGSAAGRPRSTLAAARR